MSLEYKYPLAAFRWTRHGVCACRGPARPLEPRLRHSSTAIARRKEQSVAGRHGVQLFLRHVMWSRASVLSGNLITIGRDVVTFRAWVHVSLELLGLGGKIGSGLRLGRRRCCWPIGCRGHGLPVKTAQLLELLEKVRSVRSRVRRLVDRRAHDKVLKHTISKHVEDTLAVLCVGHVLSLQHSVIFALLLIPCVTKRHSEGVKPLAERPRISRDEEGNLVIRFDLDVKAGDALSDARLGLEDVQQN